MIINKMNIITLQFLLTEKLCTDSHNMRTKLVPNWQQSKMYNIQFEIMKDLVRESQEIKKGK